MESLHYNNAATTFGALAAWVLCRLSRTPVVKWSCCSLSACTAQLMLLYRSGSVLTQVKAQTPAIPELLQSPNTHEGEVRGAGQGGLGRDVWGGGGGLLGGGGKQMAYLGFGCEVSQVVLSSKVLDEGGLCGDVGGQPHRLAYIGNAGQ